MLSQIRKGTMFLNGGKGMWLVVCFALLAAGCAHQASLRIYPNEVPGGSLRLVEVVVVATRDDVVKDKAGYDALLKLGISDEEIKDGSFVVGRIYCCGGTTEGPTHQVFYVPPGMIGQVQPSDIVEIRAGREPTGQIRGEVNTMTRVVQRTATSENTCRWVPPDPRLWMRVLYCDWMQKEGWIELKKTFDHTWYKPPATSARTE